MHLPNNKTISFSTVATKVDTARKKMLASSTPDCTKRTLDYNDQDKVELVPCLMLGHFRPNISCVFMHIIHIKVDFVTLFYWYLYF